MLFGSFVALLKCSKKVENSSFFFLLSSRVLPFPSMGYESSLGTNHWGTKVFKAQMIDKKLTRDVPNSDNMDKMISNAALVYDVVVANLF